MMTGTGSRISAALAYIPILGWLYVILVQRENALAVYHLKQSIGWVLFLIVVLAGWALVAWILAWIPYAFVVSIALFPLVIAAYFYGFVALLLGLRNALSARAVPLPLFGERANRLPIHGAE